MAKMDIKDKIKYEELLEAREKVKKRIEYIDSIFEEEKENEESWPGHASTRYQTAEIDRCVLIEHLRSIELELKKLQG